MNIITVNHTNLDGVTEALDVVMADEAEALQAENERLRAALREILDTDYARCYYVEQCDCV